MRIPVAWLALVPAVAAAGELAFSSGPAQTALLELFTSEGCSSCPPAERWLADRRGDPGLWKDFVPVAWHVTYWDDLGWRDRFAQRAFTDRQYAYARAWNSDSVYTPCFVRNGREWKRGPIMPDTTRTGVLRTRYDPLSGALQVDFVPAAGAPATHLVAHAALLGGGVVSQVRAGENAGRTLEHDFVALAVAEQALTAAAGADRATLSLPPEAGAGTPRRALAVWVTRRGELAPVQATGGWLGN